MRGRAGEALAHLQRVTGMSDAEVSGHVAAANEAFTRRSARVWELDLDMLTDAGVTLARPGVPEQRRAEADEALQRVRRSPASATDRAPAQQRPMAPMVAPPQLVQPPEQVPDVDLASNAPGIAVTHEAARRRSTDGAGADRSWRVGADGEATVAALLTELTEPSRWDRMRGRRARWRVLHSVPFLDRSGRPRGDIDHVVIGPPGVVTINTKHHPAGRVALDGDELTVNRHRTDYLGKARREAERTTEQLRAALAASARDALAQRLTVRPMIVVVGARLLVSEWAAGVNVVMPRQLVHTLTSLPERLAAADVGEVFEIARHSRTWIEPERS
ncbi:nuclease-related domain-containing protein [Actinomycetes bacterium KLBMP 9759]